MFDRAVECAAKLRALAQTKICQGGLHLQIILPFGYRIVRREQRLRNALSVVRPSCRQLIGDVFHKMCLLIGLELSFQCVAKTAALRCNFEASVRDPAKTRKRSVVKNIETIIRLQDRECTYSLACVHVSRQIADRRLGMYRPGFYKTRKRGEIP